MPKRYLTRFDDGGDRCKNDINYLRTHPECGIPFIQDRPFNPDNPMPLHKFSQIERDFDIDKYTQVPRVPRHVAPTTPKINKKIKGTIETDPYSVYMTQDTTNDYFIRRLGGKENMIEQQYSGYEPIGNNSYSHQDLIPSFEEAQAIGAVRETYEVGGDVPLEDFGAGVGRNAGTQFVDRSNFENLPSGDPRMQEEFAEQLNILFPPPQIGEPEVEEFSRNLDNIIQGSGAGTSREPIELQEIPRPRGANPQVLQETAIQNLTRNATPGEASRLRSLINPDVPDDARVFLNDLAGELAREVIQQGYGNAETGEVNLNAIRGKIANLQNDLNVLIGEPKTIVEKQIQDLQKLIRDVSPFARQEPPLDAPPDAPPSPPAPPEEEQPRQQVRVEQMFPIEPIDEYEVAMQEVEKIMRPGETELTEAQKEIIIKNMERRGVLKERTIQILAEAEVYDPAMEQALGGRTRSKAEKLARLIRGGLQHRHNDSNLRAEAFETDITDDTPILSREPGRGRTRLQKLSQRVSRQLPYELRQQYKELEREATEFSERVSRTSAEALQNIRATSTRMFGRQYAQPATEITPIDSARNVFNIDADRTAFGIDRNFEDITFTQEEARGLREAEGTAPLTEELLVRSGGRPKLTFSEHIAGIRRGATSREAGIGGTGALAGAGAGIGIGILTNDLMNKLGIQQNMATASATGGIAGAGGDVAGRIVSMGTASALEKAGITSAAETLAAATAKGLARGALEGGIIGVVLTPVDMIFNQYLYNRIHSHAKANAISSLTIGGATVGASAGIMAASETAAPFTEGVSLVVGSVAVGAITAYGWITGDTEDKREQEKINNIKATSSARTQLIKSLPKYKYNLDRAIDKFPNKSALGIDDESWSGFKSGLESTFGGTTPTPTITDKPKEKATDKATDKATQVAAVISTLTAPLTGGAGALITGQEVEKERQKKMATADQEKINKLFEQQITHYTIKELCKKGTCSNELKSKDKGALNKEEYDWLNNKMSGTLTEQENLQIQLNLQSLKFTQTQILQSQTQMLNSWNNKQELITNQDTLRRAYLDTTWKERFDTYAKLDAQRRVVRAYQDNQTTLDQLPKDIRDMANLDPEFESTIQKYYSDMATTARDMNISIPQLVQIQGTPLAQQQRVYEGMQFDTIKQNQQVVSDAQRIATQEDAVRQSAEHFYDIDQAYILTDPTGITSWNPSDAQILQAYNAGMTLREYTDYMHELAKGEAGDFSRLPIYTQEQIKQFTDADVAHFNDELNMTGHEGLYTWDEQNRSWILHNKNNTLSTRPYSSPFIPGRILRARQEYADMIHGLNDENQQSVDTFNTNLMRDLSSYGRHYDAMVGDINDERLRAGRTDLLFYDVGKIYNKNKIEFTPISDVYKPRVLKEETGQTAQTGELTPAQQREIDNAYKMFDSDTSQRPVKEQYKLSRQQYTDVKRNLESKDIVNADTEQLQTAVQEVKTSSSAP